MNYMLDTDTVIYLLNNRFPKVRERFFGKSRNEVCISTITLSELEYGVENSQNPDWNRVALLTLLSAISVVPFDVPAAREYGIIRSELKRKGTPIGSNDLFIAAHAKSLGMTLVSNNLREFERVSGLRTENWVC